jgi:hypothetical protein
MAAGRYETSKVLKTIFIEDTTTSQLSTTTSAIMTVWAPESEGMSSSTVVAVVVCVLIIVIMVVIQLVFFKRSQKATPVYRQDNHAESSVASSVSQVEDVWKKALDTYDSRGGIDPIGGYVVTLGTSDDSSENSDKAKGVELATDVEHDSHLVAFDKAAKASDPPGDSSDEEALNEDNDAPPSDEMSDMSGETNGDQSDLHSMKMSELKTELEIHGLDCCGMIEKQDCECAMIRCNCF